MGVVIITVASSRARGVGTRGLVCYVRQVMLGAERVPGDIYTFCTTWPALAWPAPAWPVLWGGGAAMLQCVAAVATDESAAGRCEWPHRKRGTTGPSTVAGRPGRLLLALPLPGACSGGFRPKAGGGGCLPASTNCDAGRGGGAIEGRRRAAKGEIRRQLLLLRKISWSEKSFLPVVAAHPIFFKRRWARSGRKLLMTRLS